MAKKKRVVLKTEERILKTLDALFILQAVQLKMSNADIRKVLGGAMSDINVVTRAVNKALKKHEKDTTKGNS